MCRRERQGWLVHIPRSTEVRGKRLNSCPDCEIGKRRRAKSGDSEVAAVLRQAPAANFLRRFVNWITFTRGLLGQGRVHRMTRAYFNVRAGKVAWRYTAPAALVFGHGPTVGCGVAQHRPHREDELAIRIDHCCDAVLTPARLPRASTQI